MDDIKRILITGGSGLIGTRLTELLLARGYDVSHLGRTIKPGGVKTFLWNIEEQSVDPEAFKNTDAIIHLAGAGVSDSRWTAKRKKELMESRTQSTRLLKDSMERIPHTIKTFIAASGVDYYGVREEAQPFVESDGPASGKQGFLTEVTHAWEAEADRVATLGLRVVKIRIGFVLSNRGGALKKLLTPVKLWVGSPLGSGRQYVNWIHIDDLCNMFIKALEDGAMQGPYNGVGPYPVTNKALMTAIARELKKPMLFPPVPGFVLKIVLGEMAEIVIRGNAVSSGKIQNAGFNFQYKTLEEALENLLA